MTAIYRLCGIPSTNPSPIYQEDKFKLNKMCLRSFVQAYRDVNPKVIFLLDHCGQEYTEMVNTVCPFEKKLIYTDLGINGTALKAYELAKDADDDIILFQECDYIYRPHSGRLMNMAIKQLGLVSPYDHLNFYIDRNLHSEMAKIKLVDGYHFRTTERNTMTFGVTKEVLLKGYDIFYKYGYLDGDVWYELKDIGIELHVPIPSIATHMVKDWLAPGVDWEDLWKELV